MKPEYVLDDAIPIEWCGERLWRSLQNMFGKAPTFRQAFETAPRDWMRVPGFGRRTLRDLNLVIFDGTGHKWTDLPRYTERKTPPRSAHPSWDEYGPRA